MNATVPGAARILSTAHAPVVLALFADAVWQAARPAYTTDRICIEATRLAIMAGRAFLYPIEPVAVACGSATADWWDHPHDKTDAPGWSVGVSGTGRRDESRNSWDGHLIGHVPIGNGFLLDIAAPQRHRPARRLNVPDPVVVEADRAALAAGFAIRQATVDVVHWYRSTDDTGWRRAAAWSGHRHLMARLAGQVIRHHRDQLDLHRAALADPTVLADLLTEEN